MNPMLIALFSTTLLAQGPQDDTPFFDEEAGLKAKTERATEGYTLFAPLRSKITRLIDLDGNLVHEWKSEHMPGNSVYLLENGSLLRAYKDESNPVFHGGGQGGGVEEIAWDGTVLWTFPFSTEDHLHHHDIEPLPNGNVLLIAWEKRGPDAAFQAGRDPRLLNADGMWPDFIVEIEPVRPSGGKVVWEWHVWDHLIQDFDPNKANYGVVADHPELLDINFDASRDEPELSEEDLQRLRDLGYVGDSPTRDDDRGGRRERRGHGGDWLHTNAVDYNAELDQIALSVRSCHEIWIIDHSTTTEEAKGHTGGRYGRGGDLLYRWGNPVNHDAGSEQDRQLFGQHDVRWLPGDNGQLLLFNNGGRGGREWSSVDQIALPLNEDGSYARDDKKFGPSEPAWSYFTGDDSFYSSFISGAQRLPSGNTLVCAGEQGRFFEVTTEGEVVWDYTNPYLGEVQRGPSGPGRRGGGMRGPDGGGRGDGPRGMGPGGPRGGPGNARAVFRAERFSPNYPGLANLKKESGEQQPR